MSIEIKLSSILARYANNQRETKVKGKTVGECLNDLVKQFPDLKKLIFDKNGKLSHAFDVFINGESAYPQGLAKPVKEGDQLHLLVIIHGG